jgi:hypothetical protein
MIVSTFTIENEPSAALALTFTGVPIMELETLGLLGRLSGLLQERPPLVSATPYRPGLIPVVFVHGTASRLHVGLKTGTVPLEAR